MNRPMLPAMSRLVIRAAPEEFGYGKRNVRLLRFCARETALLLLIGEIEVYGDCKAELVAITS
jgi:hypothetical protein